MTTKIIEDNEQSIDDLVIKAREDPVVKKLVRGSQNKLYYVGSQKVADHYLSSIDIDRNILFAAVPDENSFQLFDVTDISKKPKHIKTILSTRADMRRVGMSCYKDTAILFFSEDNMLYCRELDIKTKELKSIAEKEEYKRNIAGITVKSHGLDEKYKLASVCTDIDINDYLLGKGQHLVATGEISASHYLCDVAVGGSVSYKAAASEIRIFLGNNWKDLWDNPVVVSADLPNLGGDEPEISGIALSPLDYLAVIGQSYYPDKDVMEGFIQLYKIHSDLKKSIFCLEKQGELLCEPLTGVAFTKTGLDLVASNYGGKILFYHVRNN